MLQNAYFLAKIGFDAAENEPAKSWQIVHVKNCFLFFRAQAIEDELRKDQNVHVKKCMFATKNAFLTEPPRCGSSNSLLLAHGRGGAAWARAAARGAAGAAGGWPPALAKDRRGGGGSVGENWIEREMEDEMEHEFILLYDHYEIEKLRENQIVALFSIF